jgi:hypothetical protein
VWCLREGGTAGTSLTLHGDCLQAALRQSQEEHQWPARHAVRDTAELQQLRWAQQAPCADPFHDWSLQGSNFPCV